MEVSLEQSAGDSLEMHLHTIKNQSSTENSVDKPHSPELPSCESGMKVSKGSRPNPTTTPKGAPRISTVTKKKIDTKSGTDSNSSGIKSTLTKPTVSSALRVSGTAPVTRRISTGGLPEKQTPPLAKRPGSGISSAAAKKTSPSSSELLRKSLPELRRSSLPSPGAKPANRTSLPETRRSFPASPGSRSLTTSINSDASKTESNRRSSLRSSPSSVSSKRVPSSSVDSTGSSSSVRKSVSKVSSPSARVSSGSKGGGLSTSLERSLNLSGRRKVGTPENRGSHLIVLPQVEGKAGDDMRLDLRGHKIRSLNTGGLKLSPNLEFVYLRDNLLSTLDGVEVLKRVKVLDLSFNNFKGPGFEPLENCKALQQLYLAGNQITSLTSLPELPNLEFLSVAQNKLKSLSMASQPRLQVLAASKNKISTLKGFPYLPALEMDTNERWVKSCLSVCIQFYRPNIDFDKSLRMEENPILKMPHLEAASILLVGPTLKKFNDKDLAREEIAIAKRYPSHAALCIRGGWELCRPDQATDSTFKFLLEQWREQLPPGYMLKEAFTDQPFEGDACFCHFEFIRDNTETESGVSELNLKYQWFIGEKTPSNFTAIPGADSEVYFPKHDEIGRILKVECIPVMGQTEYPTIFAISSPVSPGTTIPKVLKIDVRGELVEGKSIKGHVEVAWCGGNPGKGVASWLRKRWNGSPVVIAGAEDEEYQLSLDDIDSCLVYMYTPVTEEGSKGEPQYSITDYVKAAPPSVNNVRITGDAVEGNIVRGKGAYFGGKEGPSKFEWRREDMDTGEFALVLTGTNEYTVTKDDIGRRLAFVYVPVNFEGQEGKSMSTTSQIVKPAPPRVANVKVIGELKEGSKVTVTGIVTGGTEASSRVQWFKTSSSTFGVEKNLEALSASKIAKAFRLPLSAVGYYIVAKFIPMTPDGEAGEPAYVISETVIEILPPSLNFLSITGDYSEGEMLTASYGYIGGHEGKSIYSWYLHEVENDSGALIPEVSGLLQYRITKDAIGKFISFVCTPVRSDGVIGEPRTVIGEERVRPGSPRLLSLQINGTAVEGTALSVEKKYWGGEEGDSIYCWFRTSSDGTPTEITGETASSYMLSVDDIGYFISVSCEPVRSDRARGPDVLSEQVGPIVPGLPTCHSLEFLGSLVEGTRLSFLASYTGGTQGDCLYEWFSVKDNGQKEKLSDEDYLDLTLDHVGVSLELVYTPVRDDGTKRCPSSLVSSPVAPGEPLGIDLAIPDCCEGEKVIPKTRYFGGQEGDGEYIWYRTKNKLYGPDLMELSTNNEDANILGKTLSYTPSLDDVGAYLALCWIPTRSDGKRGKPLVSISESAVTPARPLVANVFAKKVSLNTYVGEGEYFGGYEGASLFSWYRETSEGTTVLIDGASSRTYEVTDEDYNCRLSFGYMPVRLDSVVGELRLSEATDIILPELPRIEMLALTGKAVEGEVLTAVEVIPESESQKHVWAKYKKEVKYQWFYSSETRNDKSFEPFPSQYSCSYKVRFEDIGRYLRCECVVTDVFGRSSEPAFEETTMISPGPPRINNLEIEGRGFHTNLYAVRGIYSGGKEGKSRIQWLRSMVGSPDLISIPGETGRMYEANVDDVGYRLVALYTPVREDGVEGQPVSVSTEIIAVEPDVLKEVKQKLDLGSVKFESLCNKDRSSKKIPGVGTLERRILEVNRKRIKVVKPGSKTSFPTTEIRGTYAPPFHVELFRNDQHRLKIVVDSENEVDLMVQTRHLRDVIVLVIRGLAQRFNSTSLNTLLKIDT